MEQKLEKFLQFVDSIFAYFLHQQWFCEGHVQSIVLSLSPPSSSELINKNEDCIHILLYSCLYSAASASNMCNFVCHARAHKCVTYNV